MMKTLSLRPLLPLLVIAGTALGDHILASRLPALGDPPAAGTAASQEGTEAPGAESVSSPGIDLQAIERLMADSDATKNLAVTDPDKLAWQWFLLFNSPLTGPDPKVWELTFRQTSEVYLPDGAKPLPWGEKQPLPPEVVEKAKKQGLDLDKPFHNLDSVQQVDGLVLQDKFRGLVRYQLLMNRATFDYIDQTGLYNVNGQVQLAQAGKAANFPWNAFELKTSWIWIGADPTKLAQLQDKYYLVNAYYAVTDDDGNFTGYEVGLAALSGMHIISKPVPQWFWTTFENVYNDDFTESKIELGIPPAAQKLNRQFQKRLASQGSIFANYQLVGTQVQFVTPDGKPTLLANSQIESAFQPVSSCITCHSLASLKPDGTYFNIVDTSGGGTSYYVGNPPEEKLKGFTSLDFVWSLKRAHWAPVPAENP